MRIMSLDIVAATNVKLAAIQAESRENILAYLKRLGVSYPENMPSDHMQHYKGLARLLRTNPEYLGELKSLMANPSQMEIVLGQSPSPFSAKSNYAPGIQKAMGSLQWEPAYKLDARHALDPSEVVRGHIDPDPTLPGRDGVVYASPSVHTAKNYVGKGAVSDSYSGSPSLLPEGGFISEYKIDPKTHNYYESAGIERGKPPVHPDSAGFAYEVDVRNDTPKATNIILPKKSQYAQVPADKKWNYIRNNLSEKLREGTSSRAVLPSKYLAGVLANVAAAKAGIKYPKTMFHNNILERAAASPMGKKTIEGATGMLDKVRRLFRKWSNVI